MRVSTLNVCWLGGGGGGGGGGGSYPQLNMRTTASTKKGKIASAQLGGGTASIQILQGDSVSPDRHK